jgi:hypothetical protein
MGRGPTEDSLWSHKPFNGDKGFDNRYRVTPNIDSSRYVIFDYNRGITEWIKAIPERGSWSCWLERETDKDVKRKIQYPDCSQKDQDALEDLLKTARMSQ